MSQRILYFADSGLGDNLFAVPALMELESRYRVQAVVPAGAQAALFRALLPGVEIIPWEKSWSSALHAARKGFRAEYWLYAIGSSYKRSRLLNLIGGARKRYAFTSLAPQKAWQYEIGFDLCLIPDFSKRGWKNNIQMLTLLDPGLLSRLKPWDHYAALARERLRKHLGGADEARSLLVVHAGCNKYVGNLERYKRWPAAHFLSATETLLQSGKFSDASFFIGLSEYDLEEGFRAFAAASPAGSRIRFFTPAEHRNDLIEISRMLLQTRVFLGNDSGITHLAALLGTPSVTIMSGSGVPAYSAPDGQNARIVMHPVPCEGCTAGLSGERAVQFSCLNDWMCMTPITPAQVVREVDDLWTRTTAFEKQFALGGLAC